MQVKPAKTLWAPSSAAFQTLSDELHQLVNERAKRVLRGLRLKPSVCLDTRHGSFRDVVKEIWLQLWSQMLSKALEMTLQGEVKGRDNALGKRKWVSGLPSVQLLRRYALHPSEKEHFRTRLTNQTC